MENTCKRCNHIWRSRKKTKPISCPKCKSPYWKTTSRKRISKEYVETNVEILIRLHRAIITLTGGVHGVRDHGGIYNSVTKILTRIHRRHNSNNDAIKIGALTIRELAGRHFFNDGNKRVAYGYSKVILIILHYHLKINYIEAVDFFLKVAEHNSQVTIQEIEKWIASNITKIPTTKIDTYLKDVLYDIHNERFKKGEEDD